LKSVEAIVGDQISTVRKTKNKHKHGEENVQMKAHACVHRWVDRNWLKQFGVVKNMFK